MRLILDLGNPIGHQASGSASRQIGQSVRQRASQPTTEPGILRFQGGLAQTFDPSAALWQDRAAVSRYLRLRPRVEQRMRGPQRRRNGLQRPNFNFPAKPSGLELPISSAMALAGYSRRQLRCFLVSLSFRGCGE